MTREQLLQALLVERFAPPPPTRTRTPPAPRCDPVPADSLPDIARRRRELLAALDGRHYAEEATA